MKRVSGSLAAVLACLPLICASGCGDGGGGTSHSAEVPEDPKIRITHPTSDPAWPEADGFVTLSGTAAIDAYNSSDWTPHVRWRNATSGAHGPAQETVDWVFFFGYYPANHRWSATVPLVGGMNTIVVEAYGGSGTVGSDTITVTAPPDTTPPTVQITAPTAGSALVLADPSVVLGGIAADDRALARVEWSNAATGQSGVATGTETWTAQIALATGGNDITVTAFDASGHAAGAAIAVTRDETAPAVTIDTASLSTTDTALARLTGTASDAFGIQAVTWRNTTNGATGTAAGTVSWSAEVPVQAGPNEITVTATDLVGHASLASTPFVVDAEVVAWGDNARGQLGTGTTRAVSWPVSVAISGVRKTAAGGLHSLALMTDRTVRAWGQNLWGALGTGSTTDSPVPLPVPGLSDIQDVDAGMGYSIALTNGGTVYGWGWSYTPNPAVIPGLTGVTKIAAGPFHGVVLLNDGTARNVYGSELEDPGLDGLIAVSAGSHHSVALRDDGTVWVWGKSNVVQPLLGPTPVQMALPTIAFLGRGGCSAVSTDGKVWNWFVGQGFVDTPRQIPLPDGILEVAETSSRGAALRSDGTVWTWAHRLWYDSTGRIANIEYTEPPSAMPGLTKATAVSRSEGHALILRTP